MKGLLSGLKSESILCDAAASTSAEDESSGSTRSPLRMPSSLQNVSGVTVHSGSASSPSGTISGRSAIAATDGSEMAKLIHAIMTLKLEMAELRTCLDATSNRESKLRAANADFEDRCARLATEREKYKSKLRKAVDALSQSRKRIKDMERTSAELRVRLEATQAERDGAKRERRSTLDKLLASSSFDDEYGSIFDEGDGASVDASAAADGAVSVASRSMRSFRSTDSVDNSQRYDYVAELKGDDAGKSNSLPSRHKNRFRRGRKPNMSRDEPSLQQYQCPSDTLSDDEGYLRGNYSSSCPDQQASTSLCLLADDKDGATAMLELNDTTPRSRCTRSPHSNRRSRSMGDDDVEWNAARPTIVNGPRSWLRQSLDHVFTPGSEDSFKRESWKKRPFRIPSNLGTPHDALDDRRASLASLMLMESEQVAIKDAFDPKKGIQRIAAPAVYSRTASSPVPLPTNTNTPSLRSSSGTSSDGARSDMACAYHNDDDSLSVEDLSWPSQEERHALKEMRSRSPRTKVDEDPVPENVLADDKNEEDGTDDNSIQPTSDILGNNSRNSNSSHDTARDVDLFFDKFKAKDDDSLGSEDAQYHEQPPSKSDVGKGGTITSKGDANSVPSCYSLEGGKIPLKRMPRRNSCDAQAA